MSVQRSKDLVVRVIEEVFNAHDLDAIDRHYADDYLDHNPQVPPAGRVTGSCSRRCWPPSPTGGGRSTT
jgi:ketosteroid isomerase-like protein